jgi:hypothetical protein
MIERIKKIKILYVVKRTVAIVLSLAFLLITTWVVPVLGIVIIIILAAILLILGIIWGWS